MNDSVPELKSSVSQIVADALRSTADGLSRWLEHPIHTKQLDATHVDLDAAKASLAKPDDVLCCCSMPVELAGTAEDLVGLYQPDPAKSVASESESGEPDSEESPSVPAGHLLLAWDLPDAIWLIDRSLHETGTSEEQ